jgi:hydroxymethylglutaryl-CoA lyase
MKDAKEVLEGIERDPSIQYMALIPNEKGYDRAVESGINALSLVVGASDSFNLKNVNMTRDQSVENLGTVIKKSKEKDIFIRYNIATSFWCPYEGKVNPDLVLEMVKQAEHLGADEIVLCDTIGRANPYQVSDLFEKALSLKTDAAISAHFHDTYGLALANVAAALEVGVTRFDASIGGLGGCPFAPGAAGNAATEDIVFMLHEMDVDTGIDLQQLLACVEIVRPLTSRNLTGHFHKVQECQI